MELIAPSKIILFVSNMDEEPPNLILDIEDKAIEESSIFLFWNAQYVSFE